MGITILLFSITAKSGDTLINISLFVFVPIVVILLYLLTILGTHFTFPFFVSHLSSLLFSSPFLSVLLKVPGSEQREEREVELKAQEEIKIREVLKVSFSFSSHQALVKMFFS